MALEQNVESLQNPYQEVINETTESLNDLKDGIESHTQEYEIKSTQDGVEVKYGENSIYITLDKDLNRTFSDKTKKNILDSDLDLLEIDKSGDKNLDKLQKILKKYGLKNMTAEEIIVTSIFMKEVEKKKVQELKNLQN